MFLTEKPQAMITAFAQTYTFTLTVLYSIGSPSQKGVFNNTASLRIFPTAHSDKTNPPDGNSAVWHPACLLCGSQQTPNSFTTSPRGAAAMTAQLCPHSPRCSSGVLQRQRPYPDSSQGADKATWAAGDCSNPQSTVRRWAGQV